MRTSSGGKQRQRRCTSNSVTKRTQDRRNRLSGLKMQSPTSPELCFDLFKTKARPESRDFEIAEFSRAQKYSYLKVSTDSVEQVCAAQISSMTSITSRNIGDEHCA